MDCLQLRELLFYRLEELNVIDVQFLHGCKLPTIILVHQVCVSPAAYHQDQRNVCITNIHQVAAQEQPSSKAFSVGLMFPGLWGLWQASLP